MLDQMRKQAQSAVVLLLFGFIIFVFVFSFGAGSVGFRSGGCGRSNAAAIVNGESIDLADYHFVYNQAFQEMLSQRKEGQRIRREDRLELNDRVLDQLINKQLVLQAARDLGLRVTDEERNLAIRSNPIFQDKAKGFDYKRYKNTVQWYYKTSLTMFEELYRQDMLYNRMADIIQATARVTTEEIENAYRTMESKVNLEYVSINPAVYRIGLTPTEAETAAFVKEHLDRVEQYYKDNEAQYHTPKKVQVAHMYWEIQPDWTEDTINDKRERAELSLDDLQKGAEFGQQAKEYSEDSKTRDKAGDLGTMDMDTMTARWGAPFAEAAMALKEGELSKVVKSDKGFHIIKCVGLTPAVDRSLDEVKTEIAASLLSEQQAKTKAKQEADRLFEGISQGKTLTELLPQKQPAASVDGKPAPLDPTAFLRPRETGLIARVGGYLPQLGLDRDLAKAAFALTSQQPIPAKVWELSGPMGGDNYLVFRLVDRQDPDLSKLPEATEQLRDQLLAGRRQRQLSSWLQRRRESAQIEINQSLRNELNPLSVQQAPLQSGY
jgi:peptidyl-prolyl cis-trans isomerase D